MNIIIVHISILGHSVQSPTDLHRAGQRLQETVHHCMAQHPSVASVDLWSSVQLCPDCPDGPGFADGVGDLPLQNFYISPSSAGICGGSLKRLRLFLIYKLMKEVRQAYINLTCGFGPGHPGNNCDLKKCAGL